MRKAANPFEGVGNDLCVGTVYADMGGNENDAEGLEGSGGMAGNEETPGESDTGRAPAETRGRERSHHGGELGGNGEQWSLPQA